VRPGRLVSVLGSAVLAAATAITTGPPATAGAPTSVSCPPSPAPVTAEAAAHAWDTAARGLAALAGPRTYPFGATGQGDYRRTSAYAWTSGFYPASLWLVFQRTGDATWLGQARRYTAGLLPVADWRGTHDLGFMVGLPAGLAARLDPTRAERYAAARLAAARALSSRWNAHVGAIRSAYYGRQWGLIVDSAMNAPLLIEAGQALGGAEGRRLARRGLRHMVTLAEQFVRPDGSTAHRIAFNPATGRRIGPIPGQGLRTTSTWARGQAWAIGGFARAWALTGDARMLDAARRTADHWMSRVAAGCVPAWDLDVADDHAPRDSSAAAIVTDGLLRLAAAEPDAARAAAYRAYALTTLGTLTSPGWLVESGPGVLRRQSYDVPADAREGTYAWGDAYLLLSLSEMP
jgi:unsaturated chondroitin disaccharide hydrolase